MKLPLPPAKHLSDHEVARLLYTATELIDPALGAVEHLDPLGIKHRTFRGPEQQAISASEVPAEGIAKLIAALDDSLVKVTDASGFPGTAKWESWTADQRRDWWVSRMGTVTTALVAYPGVFGVIANRLPIQVIAGFVQQAVVLCAVARAYGIDDRHAQTDLLAHVLCRRKLDSRALLRNGSADEGHASVWDRLATSRAIVGELGRRPSPRQPWRMLGALPVIGAVADFIGEHSALRRATDSAVEKIQHNS
ncbi:hypothetical protein [Williamsia sp. D3]|uniref:hypothetical protein n=1 Tax=Williamsia sp. D3 TaxID=1313067 RepID=UPI0003D35FBD|nr:hypothetical protein [Williamsia sp. D3]ETD30139.1 hypothetical protein W823_26540 [Williamsia sp. D3]